MLLRKEGNKTPRGTATIEIMTPGAGARFDVPLHRLDPSMLAAGSYNVQCDPTNILRVRQGFTRLSAPSVGPQKPLTGGISWEGVNNAIYTIVADTDNWWQFQGGAASPWTALTNAVPVGPDDFTIFANIPVSGVDNLFGVNNNAASGLVRWIAGSSTVAPVTGVPFQSALGCFVLANRLVVFGTTEGGLFYPHRVRWSQINNPTIFPLAALADLADPGGSIKAGMRLGNLQAFIYMSGTEGTGCLQMMIAQAGDDANAFSFQEFALGEGVIPPASVAAIMAVQGTHYYLALDGHIYSFNGISTTNFGIPIQSDIAANGDRSNLKHSFAVYVPDDRHGRFYFPSKQPYPDRCVYYSFDFQRWEAPAAYPFPFRCGFTGPLNAATEEAAFVGGTNGGLYQLDNGMTDDGQPIPFNATWGAMSTSPLEAMQVQFAEAFIQQSVAKDVVILVVSGLRNPLDTATTGASFIMSLNQSNQFQQLIAPGVDSPASRHFNWLQCSLQGTASGTLACRGA